LNKPAYSSFRLRQRALILYKIIDGNIMTTGNKKGQTLASLPFVA
jgi:hypothetical protein